MAANSFQGGHGHNRNQEATIWVGGLEPQCTDELLWELFIQVGPVTDVSMPRDKVTGLHQNYGFVEFASAEDCDYVIRIMNGVRLHGKPIRVNKVMASKSKTEVEVAANLFIGNLDPEVDEKVLYDTFSAFGLVLQAKVMTDPDTSKHKGFGFINFDSFDVADQAIAAMNGQYLNGRPIQVSYAYKKDGTKGERHGTAEERLLAAKRNTTAVRPSAAGLLSLTAAAAGANGPPKLPPMPMVGAGAGAGGGFGGMPMGGMSGMGMGMPMGMGMVMPPPPPPMAFGGFGMQPPYVPPQRLLFCSVPY